jgi:hypothetical protein
VRVHVARWADAASLARAHVQDSLFTQNPIGIQTTGADNSVNPDDVSVTLATTGVIANAGSIIRISDSSITGTERESVRTAGLSSPCRRTTSPAMA